MIMAIDTALQGLVGVCTGEGCGGCEEIDAANNLTSLGLYVTEDPMYSRCKFREAGQECDLMKVLIQKRNQAITQVALDLSTLMGSGVSTRQDSYYTIGWPEVGRTLVGAQVPEVPFITIKTEDLRAGDGNQRAYIEIQKLALFLTPIAGAMVVPVRIIKESDESLLATLQFTLSRFSKNYQNVTPLRLPCDGETYRVEYDRNVAAFTVPETDYHCGCGDKLKAAKGFLIENISPAYGISLYVKVGCFDGLKLTALTGNADYRLVIGHMIRLKTMEYLLMYILGSEQVSRYSLLSDKGIIRELEFLQNDATSPYQERMKWLARERNYVVDGFCVYCSPGMRVHNALRV